jgi:hypothetical protein
MLVVAHLTDLREASARGRNEAETVMSQLLVVVVLLPGFVGITFNRK